MGCIHLHQPCFKSQDTLLLIPSLEAFILPRKSEWKSLEVVMTQSGVWWLDFACLWQNTWHRHLSGKNDIIGNLVGRMTYFGTMLQRLVPSRLVFLRSEEKLTSWWPGIIEVIEGSGQDAVKAVLPGSCILHPGLASYIWSLPMPQYNKSVKGVGQRPQYPQMPISW